MKRVAIPLLICVSLAFVFRSGPPGPAVPYRNGMMGYVEQGEALLTGLRGDWPMDRLPASAVAAALLFRERSLSDAGLRVAWGAALALLAAALESLMDAPAFFGLSPILVFALCPWNFPHDLSALLLVVVAGFLVRFAREPDARNALALSLALGSGFLLRSDLALLPPAAAALSLLAWSPRRSRRDVGAALIVLAAPYLFVLPTVWMNYRAHHRFQPFENAGVAVLAAEASLGMVDAAGRTGRFVLPSAAGLANLAWAARQAFTHPIVYVGGYLARFARALGWCSPFVFLAAWSVWLNRRRPAFQALALMIGYWLAVYSAVASVRRYFDPLQPLLIVASCALAGRLWSARPFSRRAATLVLAAALGIFLVFDGFAALRALAPARVDVATALSRAPDDWWLLLRRGRESLERGEATAAAEDFERADALLPEPARGTPAEIRLRLDLAAARLLGGDRAALDALSLDAPRDSTDLEPTIHLLRAYALAQGGARAASQDEARAAMESWSRNEMPDGFWTFLDATALGSWPPGPKARLEDVVARLYPRQDAAAPAGDPDALLAWAERRAGQGQDAEAAAALAQAAGNKLSAGQKERAARLRLRLEAH